VSADTAATSGDQQRDGVKITTTAGIANKATCRTSSWTPWAATTASPRPFAERAGRERETGVGAERRAVGGGGNDSISFLIGGFVGGVVGNPVVGNLVMDGGAGDDFLNSGLGSDVMLGGDGNDTMQWLPGTLNDTFDGGGGNDTAVVVGNANNQGDAFRLDADPTTGGRAVPAHQPRTVQDRHHHHRERGDADAERRRTVSP